MNKKKIKVNQSITQFFKPIVLQNKIIKDDQNKIEGQNKIEVNQSITQFFKPIVHLNKIAKDGQ